MRLAAKRVLGSSRTVRKNKAKIKKVMGEFKRGSLKSSSGQKVTNHKQALAISLSEQRRVDKDK